MSVVNDDDNADLFASLGIGIATLTDLALAKMQEGFSTRGMTHLMPITNVDGKTMVSIKIPSTAGTEERPLERIPLPEGTLVALVITRDGSVSAPTADTSIRAGDEIVIVTETAAEEELRDTLMGSLTEVAMPKRLAFFGPAGTHTEQACVNYDPDAVRLPYMPISEVVAAVEKGEADECVIPIENSLQGSVTETLDILIHHSSLSIRHELVLPITHFLVRAGARRSSPSTTSIRILRPWASAASSSRRGCRARKYSHR